MRGQISGEYSSSSDTVSIPRVSDEEAFSSAVDITVGDETDQEHEGFGYDDSGEVAQYEPRTRNRLSTLLSGAFGSTASVFSTVNTAIADTLRVSSNVTSALMSIVIALAFATGGVAVFDWFNQPTPALWVAEDDCEDRVANAKNSDTDALSDAEDDLEQAKLERGKKIFSVLKVYNPSMSDEHIAVILSNWEWESGGLDETGIEGVSDEPYHMGVHKTAVMQNMDAHTRGIAVSGYYFEPDGKGRCGIGLAQETGPNHKAMVEAAEKMNHHWYEFDWQLAYVIAQGATPTGDKDFFGQGHFSSQGGSLDTLCDYFTVRFEGIPGGQEHRQYASAWLSRIKGWSVDKTYADSVIAMMENMGAAAAAKEVEEQVSKCPPCGSESSDDNKYDNSGIAQAAASLAWPTHEQAAGTPTEVYRKVLPAVFNGDTYYMACDRVALASVRWSGADDDFPSVTTNQIPHMMTSPIWEKVADNPSESQLQPGDIIIYDNGGGANGHVFVYTGHEAIEKVHGSAAPSDANTVQGHLDSHTAGCETQGDFGGYTAFRCVKPMNSDKYRNVVDGYTFSNGKGVSDNKNCNRYSGDRGEIAARAALLAKENNWNDRSRYHGLLYGKNAGDPSMCSEFAIWCLYQAGADFGENLMDKDYSKNVLHHSGSKWSYSWMHVAFYRDNPDKGTVYTGDSGYMPVPGDLIIYVDSKHESATSQLYDAPIAGFNHSRICIKSDASTGEFSWVGGNGTSENYIESGHSNIKNTGASYFIHLNWAKCHGAINRGI